MTTTRCPACDAALPEGAPWCTLCFTDLRPAPEPVPVEAALVEATPAEAGPAEVGQMASVALAPAPAAAHLLAEELLEPRPPLETPAVETLTDETISDDDALTWPCVACDHLVSLELAACPTCGSPFLSAEHGTPSLVLPVVGDLADLSPAGRYALMGTGAIVLSGLLFLVLLLLGLVF